jgi:hypothetical protein
VSWGSPLKAELAVGDTHTVVPEEPVPTQIQVPIVWVGAEEVAILLANAFISQVQGQQFLLTVGQVAPPAIIGDTPEERLAQARQVSFIPSKVLGRFVMTHENVEDLVRQLNTTLEGYRQQQAQEGTSEP